MELDDKQLAMAFDCEGSFSVGESQREYTILQVTLDIAQSYCDELLFSIQSSVGYGYVESGHTWRLKGKDRILAFLDKIEPYLIVKRDEAKLIRGLLDTVGTGTPLKPEVQLLRARLLELWNANYSRAAKKARRQGADHGTASRVQRVPTGASS